MEQSPRLSLSYVAPAQAQKHVTVNETFRRLDALTHLTVLSRALSVEPAGPAEGDAYIIPASASGAAWDNFVQNALAVFQDNAWIQIHAIIGMRAYVSDEGLMSVFDGTAWVPLSSGAGSGTSTGASIFGINATADTTNRLFVKSDAVLFSHDDVTPGSGDARIIANKDTAAATASHLFQTGFSARAEFGLTGDDDFHVKVTPDGSTWHDALIVNKDDGRVGFGRAVQDTFAVEIFADLTSGNFPLRVISEKPRVFQSTLFSGTQSNGCVFFLESARGTEGSPSAKLSGDRLVQIVVDSYHSGGDFGQSARFECTATEDHAATAQGTSWQWFVTKNGTAARFEAFRVDQSGAIQMGGANTVIDENRHHQLRSYVVAGLPSASTAGQIIFVSDETGGAVIAFSDGTNWRRVSDRAVVS